MKRRILSSLFLCFCVTILAAQDPVPDKGSGILYFSGKPASTPIESISSEYAYDMNTGKVYTWSRDSSSWYPYPDITHSFGDPSGDPSTDSKLHINRTNGNMYQWDGDSWERIIGGGASEAALADTSASIRADALELPDTATTVSTKYYADLFNDNVAGRGTTTKQAFLDSLAGFQSFGDLTSLLATDPAVGYVLEDRNTGSRYKVTSDSIAGFYDTLYQRSVGTGKYIRKENQHDFVFTDANVPDSITTPVFQSTQNVSFELILTDTTTFNRVITISPDSLDEGQEITIIFEGDNSNNYYRIEATEGQSFVLENTGRKSNKYLLVANEKVVLKKLGNTLTLSANKDLSEPILIDDVNQPQYEADIIRIRGKEYRSYKEKPDNIPDSSRVLLKRLAKDPSGENLLNRSDLITHASTSCPTEGWSFNSKIRNFVDTDVLSIDGTTTVQAIVPTSGSSAAITKWIDRCNESIQFENGEIVTFSFYLMALNEGHNVSVSECFLKEGPLSTQISEVETISNTAITNTLKRFQLEFEVTQDGGGSGFYPGLEIEFSYAVGDTFIFTSAQMERRKGASLHKQTGLSSFITATDSVFLFPLIKDNTLDLSGLATETRVKSIDIQNAIDYCYNSGLCGVVTPSHNTLIDETILLREGIRLYSEQEITLDVDLQDSTKSAILFTDDEGSYYTEGQEVENINFNPVSAGYAAIDMDQSLRGRVINCDVVGQDSLKYGITIGNEGGGSVFTHIERCVITGATSSGIFYEDNVGAIHIIQGCDIKDNEVGIGGKPILLFLYGNDIESNTYNVSVDAGQEIVIDRSYFESGDMRFNGVERVSMYGGRISTGEWVFEGQLNHFIAEGVDFNSAVPYLPNKVSGSFVGNMIGSPAALGKFNSYYENSDYVKIFGNSSTAIGDQAWGKLRNKIPNADLKNGRVEGTFTGNLSGSISTDNTVLTGGAENLLTYSDSLGITGDDDRHKIITDSLAHPFTGETTVDLLIPTQDFNSPADDLRTFTLPVSPVIGEAYVFSFLAKTLSSGRNTNTSLTLELGGTNYTKIIYPTQSGDYERYSYLIDSIESTSTSFVFSIGSGALGDTIAITDLSLTRGNELRAMVRTDATTSYNQGAKLTIGDTDSTLDIVGSLSIGDTTQVNLLKDSDGDTGTSGQELSSTGSGTDWVTKYATGNGSPTTDLSGILNIAHGLGSTPTYASVTNESGDSYIFDISRGATNITVTVYDETGAIVPSTAVALSWAAFK